MIINGRSCGIFSSARKSTVDDFIQFFSRFVFRNIQETRYWISTKITTRFWWKITEIFECDDVSNWLEAKCSVLSATRPKHIFRFLFVASKYRMWPVEWQMFYVHFITFFTNLLSLSVDCNQWIDGRHISICALKTHLMKYFCVPLSISACVCWAMKWLVCGPVT